MYKKIALATGIALLATGVAAGTTNAAPELRGAPTVKMGTKPKVEDPDLGSVKLIEESVATGEKVYTGTLRSGDSIRVIQYESPVDSFESPGAVPQVDTRKVDWAGSSTSENPGMVDVSTTQNQIDVRADAMKPSLAVATTRNTVSLSWRASAPDTVYQVFRDGQILAEDAKSDFKEGGLVQDSTHEYRIVAKGSSQASSSVSEKTLRVTVSGTRSPVPMAYQPYSNAVEYKTFIPDANITLDIPGAISCGVVGQDGWSVGGDNRSYRMPSASAPAGESQFRTFMWANVNWGNPDDQSLILLKAVGPTNRYRNGAFVDTRTASSAGMAFQEAYRSGSYAQVRFNHNVGNPYCGIGSIQYNVMNRIYRSGLIEMVGWRFQAPAHEAYARFNTTGTDTWKTLIQRPNGGFSCLFEPACATDNISVSQAG